MIGQGTKASANVSLHYIEHISSTNVHMPAIRKKVNKKVQFGTALSLAKTSIQIAVSEGIVTEFIGIIMQFNIKYRCNTGFGLEETCDLSSETRSISQIPLTNLDTNTNYNISNPEYHRPKGKPPKRYKSSIEENTSKHSTSSKKCGYCSDKGHNIQGCAKYKADKENNVIN
ncbi:hypothetical protein RclHR1_04710011 [Rhizophagus clarus]|uniref:Uncharacterized protein n=1 Tax=Rhizophagus clarus TaxID=94130 RepID=A0A2Z6RNX3_9GLOM|nr:hypothetical protein RclHR1_04710011 [Rhizophagus clarus]GES77416.1 hypothetical protein GLOIN_2v1479215 [Rhizophagus clarus]